MAWDDRGGRGQWGQDPPDFEEIINKIKAKFGGKFPIGSVLIGIVLLIWVLSGIYIVAPDEVGVVKKDLEPEGKVLVHGELWHARSPEPLPAGTKVRVAGVDSLVLEVEPLKAPEEK